MKKSLSLMVSCLFVCVTFISCAPKSVYDEFVETTEIVSQDSSEVEIESEYIEPEQDEPEYIETEYVEPVKNDPYAVLVISEEYAKANKIPCLYRNNKLYSLAQIPQENQEQFGEGYSKIYNGGGIVDLTQGKYAFFSIGESNGVVLADLPELVLEENDEIRIFGGYTLPLQEIEYTGYCPPIYEFAGTGGNTGFLLYSIGSTDVYGIPKNICYCKMSCNGNTLIEEEDYYDFKSKIFDYEYEKGKLYEYSYIYVDSLKEDGFAWPAVCRKYKAGTDSYLKGEIVSEGGYAVIKYSDISDGTYMVQHPLGYTNLFLGIPFSVGK